MSELTTVARPYAKAAFDYAVEQNAIENWLAMLVFAAEVSKNETIKQLIEGSSSKDDVTKVFIGVCEEQLDQYGQNLIKVMAENNRLSLLPDVAALFSELKNEYEKTVEVAVTSAIELSSKQKDDLVQSLEKRLAKKVKLNCRVDESIIGGLFIKAGDTVIDSTVRGKLDRLATSLQS
ncbi:F0F1 ATP synthase subunit delta [Catenovulum agarivorans DS-2]|uniref:ATP synthase subunit delta n=1 Tax=Catenovulum agarivorans DS-2 TaxID=1328313 RepID=W7Q905_9ALTE|nr:F0F1 ATP synthase subunit delta [Catenovulum agarivorans]EWH09289.1 F0F1 ATP synthase subunit delta [Catenovulum agarivorans DS-2]